MTTTADASSWLKPLGPADRGLGTPAQLVCFPHSGGSAGAYRPLAAELAGEVEVLGVQYPGRQDRHDEPLVTDLHVLADRVAAVLRRHIAAVPRIFLGHSMGAVLAYEVAQRLGDEGPAVLVASGRPAPSRLRRTTSYLLSDDDLAEQVVRLGGTSAALLADPEMRALLLPLIRADYRTSETYRPRNDRPLACPIVAVGGDADPVAPLDGLLAWSDHTTGGFRWKCFTGGHFYLSEHWPGLAELVRATGHGAESRWSAGHHGSPPPAPRMPAAAATGAGGSAGTVEA